KTRNEKENVEMVKDRIFIRKIKEIPSSLETTILLNRNFEISADPKLMDDIRKCKNWENRVIQEINKRKDLFWESDGIVYRTGKIYIPNDEALRDRILHDHHYPPDIGHPGQYRMLELLKRTFWWPTIKTDVKRFIRGCDLCQ